jgi:short-subunit dehydrogenase
MNQSYAFDHQESKQKKRIFITGGTSGIGLALAKSYLDDGHEVGICGRHQPTDIPTDLQYIFADVVHRESIHSALSQFTHNHTLPLDILIINAGISMAGKKQRPKFEKIKEVVDTNVYGSLWTIEAGLEDFFHHRDNDQKSQARIQLVVVSSLASFVGLPGTSAYAASKAFLNIFTQTLAMDLYSLGVDVTLICPGFIDTPLTRKNKHAMPFIMSAEKAAKKIKTAITQKKSIYRFPSPIFVMMSMIFCLPYQVQIIIMRWIGSRFLHKEYSA